VWRRARGRVAPVDTHAGGDYPIRAGSADYGAPRSQFRWIGSFTTARSLEQAVPPMDGCHLDTKRESRSQGASRMVVRMTTGS